MVTQDTPWEMQEGFILYFCLRGSENSQKPGRTGKGGWGGKCDLLSKELPLVACGDGGM